MTPPQPAARPSPSAGSWPLSPPSRCWWALLVANTLRMLVGQRTRELALLRAVGADRRQVAASILLEAAIAGGLGAVAGVAVWVGAGALLVATSGGLLPGIPPGAATLTRRRS